MGSSTMSGMWIINITVPFSIGGSKARGVGVGHEAIAHHKGSESMIWSPKRWAI